MKLAFIHVNSVAASIKFTDKSPNSPYIPFPGLPAKIKCIKTQCHLWNKMKYKNTALNSACLFEPLTKGLHEARSYNYIINSQRSQKGKRM